VSLPTYRHPLAERWARAGGPWGPESLDDVLVTPPEREAQVAAVAGGLAAAGVGSGSTVCWQRPNGPEADALFRACWRLGAVAAPLHHLAGPADVAAMVDRLAPTVLVGPGDPVPTGPPRRRATGAVDPASVAVALGTSGSTGRPKVALHTHRALLHKARVMTGVHELGPGDRILLPAPLAHISGLLNGILLTLSGLEVSFMARWDPAEALATIARQRVTFMIGPPTFFVSLVDAPGFRPEAVRSMRLVSCGGAGVTPAFVEATSAALDCRVKRTYGSTEAPTVTTSGAADPPERAATTDGRAVGLAELRVVDPAGGPEGIDRPPGEVGELWVRGPELFAGYDDPVATAEAFAPGGWFRTGDLASLDAEGWLTVAGRLKDVIIRGGENISAAAVERVLEAHPDVRQAVAVGYPDPRLTERVCAVVVARRPFTLDDCRRWFEREGVTRFAWPERVEQLAELPLLSSGKPDRAALRRLVAPPPT
jgi:cyclohexanecarboxylate-CoA ligase